MEDALWIRLLEFRNTRHSLEKVGEGRRCGLVCISVDLCSCVRLLGLRWTRHRLEVAGEGSGGGNHGRVYVVSFPMASFRGRRYGRDKCGTADKKSLLLPYTPRSRSRRNVTAPAPPTQDAEVAWRRACLLAAQLDWLEAEDREAEAQVRGVY